MVTADDPYIVLATIAACSTSGERGLPQQLSSQLMWSGIGFNLLGHRLVVPMNEVAELLECPAVTRIPGVKPWVKGVANVRGRLLPVIDLEAFFGQPSNTTRKDQRVLVLDSGDFYTGVFVDSLFGMQHFPVESFNESCATDKTTPFYSYLRGSYETEQQSWDVFSLHELAKDPQFFNAALH